MPRINFTSRGIQAIAPPSTGRVEYWDKSTPGFGLRVSVTGEKTWVTMYRFKGRLRRQTLGSYPAMTLANASEKARVSLNAAANGKDPANLKFAERASDTFGQLANEYLVRHAKQHKKRWELDDRMLKHDLLPNWKNLKAKEISRREVLQVLDDIMERGAPIQANRVLALIRKIYNFGIARDIIQHNPCLAVPLPAKPQSRDRVLTPEEICKVWFASENENVLISTMIKLRLLTAQRGGEIESMSWNDIDLESAIWTIPAEISKNGLAHRVPLSSPALDLLKSLLFTRTSSVWVFPSPLGPEKHITHVQKAIQRVRARKECSGVHFVGHDLRRTTASHMASIGIPRLVISKILNHVESGVTAVYDRHSYDAEKRHALELWGKRLEEILMLKKQFGLTTDLTQLPEKIRLPG